MDDPKMTLELKFTDATLRALRAPEHGRWEEIGMDALDLFTNDILAMCR